MSQPLISYRSRVLLRAWLLIMACLLLSACADRDEDIKHCYLIEMKVAQEAIDACTRLIENPSMFDPVEFNAYHARGFYKRKAGDLDGAIADFDEAIRREPNEPAIYRARGEIHRIKGNEAAAARDFAKAERLNDSGSEQEQPSTKKPAGTK